MGIESLIPAGIGLIGSLAKGIGGGGQQAPQQAPAPQQNPFPQNPFPENHPDGGVRPPSMLDMMRFIAEQGGHTPGQTPGAMSDAGNNFLDDVRPPSVLDMMRFMGTTENGR